MTPARDSDAAPLNSCSRIALASAVVALRERGVWIARSARGACSFIVPPHSSPLGLVLAALAQFVEASRRVISDARSPLEQLLAHRAW
jgi:hypothetical protein